MRADILSDDKCVHVKMNKETHLALRGLLFKHNISMQDVFGECANQLADGTKIGMTIIETVVNRKLRAALEGTSLKSRRRDRLSELDSETLYSLINSGKET
jgi:hypothetical protein